MDAESGAYSVEGISFTEIRSSRRPLIVISALSDRILTGEYKLPSSKDFGDPEIGTVLEWHIKHCGHCDLNSSPGIFGKAATNFCPEYWEIVAEYSEYEVDYAWKGNP